jgi:hypothetical protein
VINLAEPPTSAVRVDAENKRTQVEGLLRGILLAGLVVQLVVLLQ